MEMRSPACFILRSVWMVTFFKVHLRIVGTAPSASPRAGRRPQGFSAGQLASGYTDPHGKISFLRARATHTSAHPRTEVLVDALVEGELVRIQGDRGEDPVLGEQVVGDGHAAEQVLLEQVLLLLEAREQEEELGLEGILLPVLVEAREEGVLLDDLVEPPAPEPLAQRARQRRLPDADRPLDHDVAVLQPVHRRAQSSTRPGSLRGLTFARPFICARADQDAGSPPWRAASGSTIRTAERSSPSAGSWRARSN